MVEELADAMGAAKDDLIGDEHDQLRKMDKKKPGHGVWSGMVGGNENGGCELRGNANGTT